MRPYSNKGTTVDILSIQSMNLIELLFFNHMINFSWTINNKLMNKNIKKSHRCGLVNFSYQYKLIKQLFLFLIPLMIFKHFVATFLFVLTIARKQIWIKYSDLEGQQEAFQKYLHRIKQGYFVDLGGYNAIKASNSIKLATWNGLIVEANEQRATGIRDLQPHVQVLNFAISNVTGETVTFYEIDFDVASTISKQAAEGRSYKQLKATVINLSDLCHKYYKAKPTIMNIDVEGVGEMALRANDWSNERCIPDIIYAQDFEVNVKAGQINLQKVVLSHNYTKMDRVQINSLFIHNSVLQFYKKQAAANADYIANKVSYNWNSQFGDILTRLLGLKEKFDPLVIPRSHPAYFYFRQKEVINIVEINDYSNFISTIGKNRPIVIMEYDQNKSSLYLGTDNVTFTDKKIKDFTFKEINANYETHSLKIFVFDHQKYDYFEVRVVEGSSNINTEILIKSIREEVKGQIKLYNWEMGLILLLVTIILILVVKLQKESTFRKLKGEYSPSQISSQAGQTTN